MIYCATLLYWPKVTGVSAQLSEHTNLRDAKSACAAIAYRERVNGMTFAISGEDRNGNASDYEGLVTVNPRTGNVSVQWIQM